MLQYPLGMGKPGRSAAKAKVLPLQTDASGRIRYDLVLSAASTSTVKGAVSDNMLSSFHDASAKNMTGGEDWARPDAEAVAASTERTRLALSGIVDGVYVR